MKATLKSIREMRGYKQEEAAKLIGIATDTLRNYEQGKSYPDIPVLRKIEETYNVRSDCRQTRCWDHPSTIFSFKVKLYPKIS